MSAEHTATQEAGQAQPVALADVVSEALLTAFNFGEMFHEQADSESLSARKRAAVTFSRFRQLVDEIRSIVLAASPTAPVQQEPVAWMRTNRKECITAESKRQMENTDFGSWKEVAASFTIPLGYAAPVAAQPQEAGQARELPPPNSLPTWSECAMRVENSDFIAKRVAEGGYGAEPDSLLASALHRFIYEYDDADPYSSAWFMHRLELVLKEAAPAVIAAQPASLEKQNADMRQSQQHVISSAMSIEHAERIARLAIERNSGAAVDTDPQRLDAMENMTPDQCIAIIEDAAKNRTLRAAIDAAIAAQSKGGK